MATGPKRSPESFRVNRIVLPSNRPQNNIASSMDCFVAPEHISLGRCDMEYLDDTLKLLAKLDSAHESQQYKWPWYKVEDFRGEMCECLLCNQKMRVDMYTEHSQEAGHLEKVEKLDSTLNKARSFLTRATWLYRGASGDLFQRTHELESAAWRDEVISANNVVSYLQGTSAPTHNGMPFSIESIVKLYHFEDFQRLALLQLAVWKSECLKQVPVGDSFGIDQWLTSGWKEHKAKQRESNSMTIIITSVRPFLTKKVELVR